MRFRSIFRTLFFVAYLTSVTVAYAADTIVLGQSAPLSGDNAAFGKDIRDGALAYFNLVNAAGGIGGKQIELVTLDDANDRKRAGENAATLLNVNRAVALFGFASATLSLDALPLAERLRAPVFATFTGAPVVRKSPVTFTIRPTYDQEMEKILEFWQTKGVQRVAVIHYDDEVGLQNLASVAERVKQRTNQPVMSVPIKRNATIADESIKKIIASDPELVVSTVASSHAAGTLEKLRNQSKFYYMSATSFVGSSQFLKLVGNKGAGVSITQVVPSPASVTIPVVVECRRALAAAKLSELNYTNLEACIAAKVLVEGMRKTSRDVTRGSLLNALQNLGNFDTGGFTIAFSRGSNHGSKWTDLTVITKAGTFGG
jgi:branched-chain amino acid transport system substrate-binding protein